MPDEVGYGVRDEGVMSGNRSAGGNSVDASGISGELGDGKRVL